jgi:hypothetical protein
VYLIVTVLLVTPKYFLLWERLKDRRNEIPRTGDEDDRNIVSAGITHSRVIS